MVLFILSKLVHFKLSNVWSFPRKFLCVEMAPQGFHGQHLYIKMQKRQLRVSLMSLGRDYQEKGLPLLR